MKTVCGQAKPHQTRPHSEVSTNSAKPTPVSRKNIR